MLSGSMQKTKTPLILRCALIYTLLSGVQVTSAGKGPPDLAKLEVRRIQIEKRWDRPTPTSVPEVAGVLKENVFYSNSPNHPLLGREDKAYTPLRDGGFYIEDGPRYFNRPLFYRGNMVGTGDRPIFIITRGYGRQWAAKLRFAFSRGRRSRWLDQFSSIRTSFWAGRAEYLCEEAELGLRVKLVAAPGLKGWSSLFALEVGGPGANEASVHWVFGDIVCEWGNKDGMWWLPKKEFGDAPGNRTSQISPESFRLSIDTEDERWKQALSKMELSSLDFYIGSKWGGQQLRAVKSADQLLRAGSAISIAEGNLAACSAPVKGSKQGYVVIVWGGEPNHRSLSKLESDMRRLNLPWGEALYREWYENYVGRGSHPAEAFAEVMDAPERAMAEAQAFWREIQQRVIISLPDDELNAWANWLVASQEYLHWPLGQMSSLDVWGQIYLHISNMYSGWDYLGVHDQQQKWLRLFATSVRNGWIGLYHGIAPWRAGPEVANGGEEDQIAHYLNYVYTHWLWTGDDQFVRDIWPFVKQLLGRELEQNDSDGDGLFASRYPYWAPENDSWGPKTGLQSAQMLRALRGAADMAKAVGDEQAASFYAGYAAKTEKALPQLWDRMSGVLGWRDPLDVLHIHPGASEIFLPILRGAVTPFEGYQMLRFVRENLWSEVTPGTARIWLCGDFGGKHGLGPLPDVAWNTLSAASIVGAIDQYYSVLKTYAHSYFFNSWPGAECSGISAWGSGAAGMNDHNDGRMPALYLLGRGLFGLEPDLPHHRIIIEPRFPSHWPAASIKTPDLSYQFHQTPAAVSIEITTVKTLAKVVRIPVIREVKEVVVDGKKTSFKIEPAINRAFVVIELPAGKENSIVVRTDGSPLQLKSDLNVSRGGPFRVEIKGAASIELEDPQRALKAHVVKGDVLEAMPERTGNRTAFIRASRGETSFYLPLDLKVADPFAILSPKLDMGRRMLNFAVENRSGRMGRVQARVKFGGITRPVDLNLAEGKRVDVSVPLDELAFDSISPGSNPIELEINGGVYQHPFIDWTLPGVEKEQWARRLIMLDLAWDYHEEAVSLFNTKFYYDAWQMGIDYPVLPPATYEWAGHRIENPRINSTRFLAAGRVPFYLASEEKLGGVYQSAEGGGPRNVLPVANWRPGIYPSNIVLPLRGMRLSKVYFLAYSWQRGHKTYHPNVELIANYADGSHSIRQLIPPFSFMPQHGLEPVGLNPYQPEVTDAGLPIGREDADIYDLALDPTRDLTSVEVRSVATESIYAIFGITLVKAK
jgi:hypothetical protein